MKLLHCKPLKPIATFAAVQLSTGRRALLLLRAARSSDGMSEASSKAVSTPTLLHYTQRAEDFWLGTKDHDVTQNRDALLRHLHQQQRQEGKTGTAAAGEAGEAYPSSFDILDLGCGPGRDVKAFYDLGHRVTGVDGCPEFVRMAQQHSPQAVLLLQDLHSLSLDQEAFDGIFANAVLFHVHRPELPRVMSDLHAALRPGGVLFVSNPRSMDSSDRESQQGGGESDQRYGHYQTLASWRATCSSAGFEELEHYFRPPGQPREQQPWLASVWRKV